MEKDMIRIDNNLTIKNYQEDFLRFVDVSQRTIESYSSGIKQFIKYLDENNITHPTREDIISFRDSKKETNSVATANAYLSSLKAFFGYLEYNGIYKDITQNVKNLRDTNLHKRKFFSSDTCKSLLENCKNEREKIMFVLTLTTGLRINELINIQLEDFKIINDKVCLYVLGKARKYKQDYVIVDNEVYEMIQDYVKNYNITNYLFVSNSNHNKGNKMTTHSARRIINALYERCGIKDEQTTFHSIRHSFATISIQNGATTREVCKALRQTSTVVTERYLHDLDNINNKCSGIVTNQILGGAL